MLGLQIVRANVQRLGFGMAAEIDANGAERWFRRREGRPMKRAAHPLPSLPSRPNAERRRLTDRTTGAVARSGLPLIRRLRKRAQQGHNLRNSDRQPAARGVERLPVWCAAELLHAPGQRRHTAGRKSGGDRRSPNGSYIVVRSTARFGGKYTVTGAFRGNDSVGRKNSSSALPYMARVSGLETVSRTSRLIGSRSAGG
jgi:hypothetical protein